MFAMPHDSVMEQFIGYYIEGCEVVSPGYAANKANSVAKIMYETKLYIMVYFLFWTSFFMYQRENVIKAIPVDIKANYVSVLYIFIICFNNFYFGRNFLRFIMRNINFTKQRNWIDSWTIHQEMFCFEMRICLLFNVCILIIQKFYNKKV